jgi:alpha,alpha-trehalase
LYPLNFINKSQKSFATIGVLAKAFVEKYLLKDGGIVSTPNNTGQQWDAPNGWAPQQWMAIEGLERCNQKALAKEIAMRWIKLNNDVYLRTNKLMEKYNVVDLKLEAGGGEYPSQDGFGWTNGVLLALIKKYDKANTYLGSSK